jgi:hypothetical protein
LATELYFAHLREDCQTFLIDFLLDLVSSLGAQSVWANGLRPREGRRSRQLFRPGSMTS